MNRFWKFAANRDDDARCWEWQSTRNQHGYGKFWLDGKTVIAHRVAYELAKGPIPTGLMVRHSCDNPPCVNPAHLSVGTVLDNARDALERGRYRRGEGNGRAKLTAANVIEIKSSWASGETQVSLARRFFVSRAAIQWVLSGHNWAHIEEAS